MRTYEIDVPEGTDPERGIEIRCPIHDESEHFQPGYRRVNFACTECGIEVTVSVDDLDDWRDLQEMC